MGQLRAANKRHNRAVVRLQARTKPAKISLGASSKPTKPAS